MLKRPRLVIILILVLGVLALLALPARTASNLKLVIGSLFLPLFGLSSAVQNGMEHAGNLVVPRHVLLQQVHQLQEENKSLRLQLAHFEESQQENQRFRQYYSFQQSAPWKLKLARVIGRDPGNWWRSILIDVGSTDGVRTNLAVITPEGLVGRVDRTGLKQSQVLLVGDPSCLAAALVQETRDHGIITPAEPPSLDASLVHLTHLIRSSGVQAGHKVITSGLGGIFPKGIPVGSVQEVRSVDFGLYIEARVRLSARLSALEEVWVILP
ncbi:MAG TPA: rod shape-determining protein MreC [Candidatus Paceibacterota bacterium]|nr:rod shape-determining protein MreC [Verrucomicrobiota bacterium]HRY48717.1 rod shape-determining protein MreC [Candidatus Paceibacterota bacterium]HSA01863.1 rod shape-determining protein MreC [Candidatus Paceibacterota bacterium]